MDPSNYNSGNDFSGRAEKLPPLKLAISQYIVALVMLVLVSGLWRLQVLGANNYRVLAEQNRTRKVVVLAPRGKIFDRENRLLVDNYPSVSCYLLREQLHNQDLPEIAAGLHLTMDQLQSTLRHYQAEPRYQPIPLKEDITPDEQAFVEAHRNELPELETIDQQRRLYPRDGFAAHMIGYVGEVSEEMLTDPKYAVFEPGDLVGRSGIEESYDAILRGQNGSRDIVVDSHGREIAQGGTTPSKPGKDLRLTIDLDIQMAAEKALGNRNGAIVAMDPHTGEVLAMVSRPTFDPNAFAVRISREAWAKVTSDPDHPLMNKAIQAQLAPGSTFKIIMSVAGLQEGVAQDMHVMCNGGASFYGHFYKCDRRHGMVDINHAIPWSCDTFFYTLANKLGIDTMAKYATSIGIGQKTGIDLPDEATGLMPSEQWKLHTFHEQWFAGETISVGIGQGAIEASPIQLARALSGIASGGVFRKPHLVFPDEVPPEMKDAFPGSGNATITLDPANWETITDGMAAVTGPGGTAGASHMQNIDFAGKTGTAQTISGDALGKLGGSHASFRPNSWFVGMTPRRDPDIVVAVLWQGGDQGANSAHLAAAVIAAFVDKQRAQEHNLRIAEKAPTPALPPAVPATVPATGSSPSKTPSQTPSHPSTPASTTPPKASTKLDSPSKKPSISTSTSPVTAAPIPMLGLWTGPNGVLHTTHFTVN